MTLIFRQYDNGLSLEKPAPETWDFSEYWVANRRDDGVAEMIDDTLVIHLREGDLIYRIIASPGVHEDENEPAGYRLIHHYECELVSQPPTHTG